ncbi:DUF3291 domain-containing protein [Nocardiopsis metallicus]|uniref:DUF3291 domain-containing protein n=1 Tax=Nocardiopsis metallicus TaxID=179819 RepID=A0A840W0Z7_9ACTN|nr:DUF3291 domain-containing protein [Nocardiopsis metallicus]MBB5488953.1 hypothetical protein [Nocardiopsis metallicus]
MRSLLPRRTDHHVSTRTKAARSRCTASEPARAAHWTTLVEARTITGDREHLRPLVAALRAQAEDHLGHLGEVHFIDEGDRIRLVGRWRSPADLRSFVERSHRELLLYRAEAGLFPTVERTLWWSTAGTGVSAAEAGERAELLRTRGPGPRAFTLASPVPPPAG